MTVFLLTAQKIRAAGYTFDGVVYSPADRVKATTDLIYVADKWLPTYNAKSERNFSWLFGISRVKKDSVLS